MRVRPGYHPGGIQAYRFNPRTRESATIPNQPALLPDQVSIHALVRVRPGHISQGTFIFGFNPRTRESATGHGKPQKVDVEVSIHALVRVRPQKEGTKVKREKVSIHALVRVRLPSPPRGNPGRCFNPRTRESATSINLNQWVWVIVSIHALVRVRLYRHQPFSSFPKFQSTHS